MQYSTLPFTLVGSDEPYLIDVAALYTQAQTLIDQRKARGRRYPLALIVTVALLAKLAGQQLAHCASRSHFEFGQTALSSRVNCFLWASCNDACG